jgi:hypothetical protein
MMLSLDHEQRINLILVLGGTPFPGREQHKVWHLQDFLDLDEEEKQAIGYHLVPVNGSHHKIPGWDQKKSLPARTFEISKEDFERIRLAVEEYKFLPSRERAWLEPVKAQLAAAEAK